MHLVQSLIGIFIRQGNTCLSQKAPAITRKKESRDKLFTKEMLSNVFRV